MGYYMLTVVAIHAVLMVLARWVPGLLQVVLYTFAGFMLIGFIVMMVQQFRTGKFGSSKSQDDLSSDPPWDGHGRGDSDDPGDSQ